MGSVAQLGIRASGCGPGGHGFNSHRSHQFETKGSVMNLDVDKLTKDVVKRLQEEKDRISSFSPDYFNPVIFYLMLSQERIVGDDQKNYMNPVCQEKVKYFPDEYPFSSQKLGDFSSWISWKAAYDPVTIHDNICHYVYFVRWGTKTLMHDIVLGQGSILYFGLIGCALPPWVDRWHFQVF